MLVDPDMRRAVANDVDSAGLLTPAAGGLFSGTLPTDTMLSNTATDIDDVN